MARWPVGPDEVYDSRKKHAAKAATPHQSPAVTASPQGEALSPSQPLFSEGIQGRTASGANPLRVCDAATANKYRKVARLPKAPPQAAEGEAIFRSPPETRGPRREDAGRKVRGARSNFKERFPLASYSSLTDTSAPAWCCPRCGSAGRGRGSGRSRPGSPCPGRGWPGR